MWIPHSQGRLRRMRISKFIFSLGITGAAVALVFLFFLIYSYVQLKDKVNLLDELGRVNRIQEVKIFSLAEKVKDFSETMERLKELEDKLRTLAGVGDTSGKQANLGKGGPQVYLSPVEGPAVGLPEQFIVGKEHLFSYALIGRTEESVNYLEREARRREEGMGEIEKILLQKKDLFASTPNIFPVQGWISSGFGQRINPFTKNREIHQAIDIVAPWGTEIKAAAQGEVISAGWLNSSYGLAIRVRDGYGYSTVYGHLSSILVKKGSWLSKGEVIGRVGSTGRSTGPHLHFEVWFKEKPINPLNLMVEPLG